MAIATSTVAAGCGSLMIDGFPDLGHVVVVATDAAGAPVANVVCELHFADNNNQILWRSGTTGTNGRVAIAEEEGGILPNAYLLVIKPPTGYALAPAQATPIPVVVRERETVNIDVKLTH